MPQAKMPEKGMADLAGTTGHQTFKVLAEWMKENREGWERHLGAQDKKLDEIHKEVRRTNGRVTDLEKKAELAVALKEAEERVTADLTSKQEKQLERGSVKRQAMMASGATVLGGCAAGVGHALGLW